MIGSLHSRFLETVFTFLTSWWLYEVTIINFGNIEYALDGHWTIDASIIFHGLIGAVVQSFFAYRIFKVSNLLIWPTIAWLGAIARVILNVYLSYGAFTTVKITTYSSTYAAELNADLILGAALDVLVATVLTWYLSRMRTEFQ